MEYAAKVGEWQAVFARPDERSGILIGVTLRIGAALSIRPIAWLGEISYSLYLIHFPIVGAVSFGWIWGAGHGIPENFALIVVIGGSLSLAAATGFHWLFERRYLSRRQPSLAAI